MVRAAPPTDLRVVRFVRRFERRATSIADVVRATGVFCERCDIPRPSYESVRVLVHDARDRRERRRAAARLVLEVDLRARPPSDLEHLLNDPRQSARLRGR